MAQRVVWSPLAADNFEKAVEHIAVNSRNYAALFARKILEMTKKLEDFPELGRIVPEYSNTVLRELFHGNYRLVYRIKNGLIEIAALAHCSQLRRTYS